MRNEKSAKAGKQSTINQIDNHYSIALPKTLERPPISHCGNCNSFCAEFSANTDLTTIGEYPHCGNTQNITTIDEYLSFNYHFMLTYHNEKYVKPTLIVSDGFVEFGSRTYDDYGNLSMILSKDYNSYMIVGEGGIGKTIFLSKLFFEIVMDSLRNDFKSIPIWLKADYFGHEIMSPEDWFNKKTNERFSSFDFSTYMNNPSYNVYIFIDGINGLQYTNQKDFEKKIFAWAKFIEEYTDKYPNVSFVLSSRDVSAIECFSTQKQRKIYIQNLNVDKARKFIRLFAESEVQIKCSEAIISKHKDLPFVFIPYFLRKIINSSQKNTIISNKTDIVLLYISHLFENYKNNSPLRLKAKRDLISGFKIYDLKCDEHFFFDVVFEFAYLCQSNNKKVINREDIDALYPSDSTIQNIIDIAINENLLLQNGKVYSFTHPILQEFLSAMRINRSNKGQYLPNTIIPFDDVAMSMEVLPHIYNLVNNKEIFINTLIKSNNLLFAAECVRNNGSSLKRKVSESIIKKLKNNNITLNEKTELGFYLGEIGDIRFTKTNDYIEPPTVSFAGVSKVKVGCFPVTNAEFSLFLEDSGYTNKIYWEVGINHGWFNYNKVFDVMIDFWYDIRRRFGLSPNSFINFCRNELIDIEKCACLAWFLSMSDDEIRIMFSDLYNQEKYKKPLLWDNPNYNNPAQPVVGVSYYETLAYCAWLSSKTGKNYRLPKDSEWEMMAKASTRKYIWGNNYTSEVCNTLESNLKTILPVGLLEKNKSADGVYDINGNIFEWTNSIYRRDEEPLNIQYVVKGGSWIQNKERAMSKYIGRAKAWCRNSDIGFRVCLDENN